MRTLIRIAASSAVILLSSLALPSRGARGEARRDDVLDRLVHSGATSSSGISGPEETEADSFG